MRYILFKKENPLLLPNKKQVGLSGSFTSGENNSDFHGHLGRDMGGLD